MDGISTPIAILLVVFILGPLLVYNVARQRSKEYKQGKRKFNALSNNLLQLRGHVITEADRWPIYARPVMFTDIDHSAQVEFARAQKAIRDADEIVPEISGIPEPKTSEKFNLKSVFFSIKTCKIAITVIKH